MNKQNKIDPQIQRKADDGQSGEWGGRGRRKKLKGKY